ncbi:uncharacterized protein LOC144704079 [Wolffia australiana]
MAGQLQWREHRRNLSLYPPLKSSNPCNGGHLSDLDLYPPLFSPINGLGMNQRDLKLYPPLFSQIPFLNPGPQSLNHRFHLNLDHNRHPERPVDLSANPADLAPSVPIQEDVSVSRFPEEEPDELEEEGEDCVYVLTDEWAEFFAKSEAKRQLERKRRKNQKKTSA